MRNPVKITVESLPAWLSPIGRVLNHRFFKIGGNPRKLMGGAVLGASRDEFDNHEAFSRCVSALTAGRTVKLTERDRHPLTDSVIQGLVGGFRPTLLDVGVSDGTTSLDLIRKLGKEFSKYFVTDLSFSIFVQVDRSGTHYFYDHNKSCFLISRGVFLFYSSLEGALWPLNAVVGSMFSHAPAFDRFSAQTIPILQPELRKLSAQDERIQVIEYDVFERWPSEKVDIVKVANVLNRVYFSDELIRKALSNLKGALKVGGHLSVIDNRKKETSSIFLRNKTGFALVDKINGGTDISNLVLTV